VAAGPSDFFRKVADEFKYLRDHHAERAEKGNVDKSIREQVKADLDTLVEKNEKRGG
jgi:hypothetical protein